MAFQSTLRSLRSLFNTSSSSSSGTFNKMFFSQTSGTFTAPYTGNYKITLKGGGGGGGGASTSNRVSGSGGGEGGTIIFYTILTQGQSYSYVIGAGGSAGSNGTSGSNVVNGGNGGISSFNNEYTIEGGIGGVRQLSNGLSRPGGRIYTAPNNNVVFVIPGQTSVSGTHSSSTSFIPPSGIGGGLSYRNINDDNYVQEYGGGGAGGGAVTLNESSLGYANPMPGGNGYILIEYMEW